MCYIKAKSIDSSLICKKESEKCTLFLILLSSRGSFLSLSLSLLPFFCKLLSSPPSRDLWRLRHEPSGFWLLPKFPLSALPLIFEPVAFSPPLSNEFRLFVKHDLTGLFLSVKSFEQLVPEESTSFSSADWPRRLLISARMI